MSAKCLRCTLTFLKRYSDAVVGWESENTINGSPEPPSFPAMLDWRNDDNLTPLLLACSVGNYAAVQLLIQFGADSSLTEPSRRSNGLILATRAGSVKTCEALLADVSDTTVLQWCALRKRTVQQLRCNPCHCDASGKSALMVAAELGHLSILSLLLQHGMSYHQVTTIK